MTMTLKPTISNAGVKEVVIIVDCITESHVQIKAASYGFVINDSDNEAKRHVA